MKKLTGIIALSLILASCGEEEVWMGVFYPDADWLSKYRTLGNYGTYGECRVALKYIMGIASSDNPTAECGKNCKYNTDYDIYTCEETVGLGER